MKYKLSEICDILSSKRIFMSEYTKSGVPFFRGKEVSEKALSNSDISTELFISEERFFEIKNKFGAPLRGDILITAVGTIGNVWLVNMENFYFKDGNVLWLRSIDSKIANNKYLYYFLKSKLFMDQVNSLLIGSSQKALLIDTLRNIKIDLPDLETQQKIVRILSALDSKIELNNQQNQTLELILDKLYDENFVNKRDNDWAEYSLEELLDYKGGYSYTSKELVETSNTGMMTIKNFERNGGFKIDGFKPLLPQKNRVPLIEPLDILIACTDVTQNADIIGNAVLVLNKNGYENITFSMDLVKIIPKNINKFILYMILKSKEFKGFALGYKSGTTVLHLNKKCLKEFKIQLPKENEMEKFAEIVETTYKKIATNIKNSQELEKIRDILLPKLMNGKIDLEGING